MDDDLAVLLPNRILFLQQPARTARSGAPPERLAGALGVSLAELFWPFPQRQTRKSASKAVEGRHPPCGKSRPPQSELAPSAFGALRELFVTPLFDHRKIKASSQKLAERLLLPND
jgi:hypothetical protein